MEAFAAEILEANDFGGLWGRNMFERSYDIAPLNGHFRGTGDGKPTEFRVPSLETSPLGLDGL